MSLDEFKENCWKNSHEAYAGSGFLNIQPSPEFATAEVMVSSLYRAIGFEGVAEKGVPVQGREFARNSQSEGFHEKTGSKIDLQTWQVVINSILESPKQPNQSSKRFLQMIPLVPDIALYSGSARLAGNSWNPGSLIQRIVGLGCDNFADGQKLWQQLFEAMSVGDTDDVWARWLCQEFQFRRRSGPQWSQTTFPNACGLPEHEKRSLDFPAKQFVRDLVGIIQAKPLLTRRQWVSLLESILRLGSVSHVLWICDLNFRLWQLLRQALESGCSTASGEVALKCVSRDSPYLTYGNPAVPRIKTHASNYLVGRLGINAVLWHLEGLGHRIGPINSCAQLAGFLDVVTEKRESLIGAGVLKTVNDIKDSEKSIRDFHCKKGIGSNLIEFARHVLAQRQTANEIFRGYDQGYILRKKSEYMTAPWIVKLGPVAVLAVVHSCLRGAAGPRSIRSLCEHLEHYGIQIDKDNVTTGDLGKQLRMLGLVLDSPDAESGMLLVPPFDYSKSNQLTPKE